MTRKIPYTQVNVPVEVKEKIKYLAVAQRKKMSVLLKEIIDELFDQASEFKQCNMVVAGHSGSVTFAFGGRSMLVSGSFPSSTMLSDSEADKLISEKVGKQFKEVEEQ